MMNNEDIINKITEHQKNPMFHPLTCGNDSRHNLLIPIEKGGNVILICPDCNYEQYYIPI